MRTFKNTLSFTIALTSILFLLAASQASAHDTHRSHRHYTNKHHKHQHHRRHNTQRRHSTYTRKHRNHHYSDTTTVIVTDNYLGSTVVVSSDWCPSHRLQHTHIPSQPTYYYSSTYQTPLNPIVSSYRTRENGQCYQVNIDSYGNKQMTLLDYRACY